MVIKKIDLHEGLSPRKYHCGAWRRQGICGRVRCTDQFLSLHLHKNFFFNSRSLSFLIYKVGIVISFVSTDKVKPNLKISSGLSGERHLRTLEAESTVTSLRKLGQQRLADAYF